MIREDIQIIKVELGMELRFAWFQSPHFVKKNGRLALVSFVINMTYVSGIWIQANYAMALLRKVKG